LGFQTDDDQEGDPKQPTTPGRRVRVLIVDDDPQVLRSLQRALAEQEVLTADGGRAALELLEEDQRFDVILCDLLMHGMNGMDLFAELDRRFPALTPRVVFMTGGAFTEAAQEFLARVPNTCIQKPFDLRALRSAIASRA
jgi:CheY-like chemotaxis protein